MAQDYSQDVNGLGSPIMATLIPYQIAPEGDKICLFVSKLVCLFKAVCLCKAA